MPETNIPHLVTNGATYIGPFNDLESALGHLIRLGLTGYRAEQLTAPVLPDSAIGK